MTSPDSSSVDRGSPIRDQALQPRQRVVLIAGLADGKMAARFLADHPSVDLVGVFVLDEHMGSAYSGYARFDDVDAPVYEMAHIRNEVEAIAALDPTVIFVVGFSQIIPRAILSIPPLGVVGFHGALLPERRGCSPLIWAVIDGLTESGVSMFYLDEGIDTGDVIAQKRFMIGDSDQAADVLEKANQATLSLLEENLEAVLGGTAARVSQQGSPSSYTRKREPADAEIDWSRPAREIINLVRALGPPYPLAHTFGGDGTPILIERVRLAEGPELPPPRLRRHDPFLRRVLCVVAHPDDEVLGVGGTLARHADAGGEVVVVILSEGEDEKLDGTPRSDQRRQSALAAAEALGVTETIFHDYPDQRLDVVPMVELVRAIEEVVIQHRPQVVYTHHGGDANTDHQVTFKATYAACRPMSRIGASVERLLAFETPSSTDQAPQVGEYIFGPNSFVDVERVWDRKIQALKSYPSEMIGGIHPRSFEYIEALARMRGGYAGVRLAEAFVIVRERLPASL
ncbi:MAG: PIG-L family deacetylase [Actinomycetota bacterium]